jgi:hypothetical protein
MREAARITAYEAKVETMMVSKSMQEGTKLAMRETRLLQNLQNSRRDTNCVKFKRAAEWNPILQTD